MKLNKILSGIALAVSVTVGSAASAATLNFYNDAGAEDVLRFTMTCSLGCEGSLLDGTPSTFSMTKGDLSAFPKMGANGITAALNASAGTSYTAGNEVDAGGVMSLMFTSSAEYLTLKIGQSPNFGIIKNTGGAGNKFTFTQVATGSGFSHYREYGTIDPNPVPLPAAGWLLLAGLGGLAAARRK